MVWVAMLGSLLLTQTTGGAGHDNPVRVQRLTDRWTWASYPTYDLGNVPAGVYAYSAPVWQGVPQVQASGVYTALPCLPESGTHGFPITVKLDGSWRVGSNFNAYAEWVTTNTSAGNVRLQLYCIGPNGPGDTVPDVSGSPINITIAAPASQDLIVRSSLLMVPGAATELEDFNFCSIVRNGAHAADTHTGDFCVSLFTITNPIDSIGTDTEFGKTP